MSTLTQNLGLIKPDKVETINLDVINDNYDIIDTAYKETNDKLNKQNLNIYRMLSQIDSSYTWDNFFLKLVPQDSILIISIDDSDISKAFANNCIPIEKSGLLEVKNSGKAVINFVTDEQVMYYTETSNLSEANIFNWNTIFTGTGDSGELDIVEVKKEVDEIKVTMSELSRDLPIVKSVTGSFPSAVNNWSEAVAYPEGFTKENCIPVAIRCKQGESSREYYNASGAQQIETTDSGVRVYLESAGNAYVNGQFIVYLLKQ